MAWASMQREHEVLKRERAGLPGEHGLAKEAEDDENCRALGQRAAMAS
jgi:hypothetical protein